MLHVVVCLVVVCSQACASLGLVLDALLVCLPTFAYLASQHGEVEAVFKAQCWVQLLGLTLIGLLCMEIKIKAYGVHQRIDKMHLRQFNIEQKLLDHVHPQCVSLDAHASREGMTAILGGLMLTALVCLVIYHGYHQMLGDDDATDGSMASIGRAFHSFFSQAMLGCDPTRIVGFVGVCLLFYFLSGFLQLALTHICRGARICSTIAPAEELRVHAYKTAAEAFDAEQQALEYVSMLDKNPHAIQAWVGNNEPTVLMLKQLVVMHGGQNGIEECIEVHTDRRAKQMLDMRIEGEFKPSQTNQWCDVNQDADAIDAVFQDTLSRGRAVAAGATRAATGAISAVARVGAGAALGPSAMLFSGARPQTAPQTAPSLLPPKLH